MTRWHLYKLTLYYLWTSVVSMLKEIVCAVPLGVAVGILTKLCISVYNKKRNHPISRKREKGISLMAVYFTVLLQLTIFYRTWGTVRKIDLIPFNTPGGIPHIILYAIANALVFMPLGFLLPIAWERTNTIKKILVSGFIVSLFIELAQLVLRCGTFQTEDLIMNTLGTWIGYLHYKLHTNNN